MCGQRTRMIGPLVSFEHGQMVWVPDAANRAPGVIAAWATDRDVVVDWTLGHYNYDFFLVRWDKSSSLGNGARWCSQRR